MLLKKKKIVSEAIIFNRVRKFTKNICKVCLYEGSYLCCDFYNSCTEYIYHKGYDSRILKHLKYFYFISQHVI